MRIKGEKIILRDMIKKDIEDRIYWETVETEWLDWDAPWEDEEFDVKEYRNRMNYYLSRRLDEARFRYTMQICINDEEEKHIGWVSAYYIDDSYEYSNKGEIAVGVGIPDVEERRKGYATEAWLLYIDYIINQGFDEIYTQTWSGNERVIGLMKKIGFDVVNRNIKSREVRGQLYDGLTFKLDLVKFKDVYSENIKFREESIS